ncbi:C40 family peptidase [Microcella alkalica]|uniref:C40 family peptidase n=1 Tax=Microcella alkalica TaxID=355930 RepID=UPI00145DF860|nr:C40 family peptidase [Microcella alkalica]
MRRPERQVIGAVALATALILGLGVTPAIAAPDDAPTWDEVQQAKGDVAATEAAIERIADAVRELEATYAAAARDAQMAAEEYALALVAVDEAAATLASLERREAAAGERAAASAQRAGQLATQLMRAGHGDITTSLLIGGDADGLLWRLGSMTKLGEHSAALMALATYDQNTARALADQADAARTALEDRSVEAEQAFDRAAESVAAAEQAVAEQTAAMDELSLRLAALTGRSVELERAYLESIAAAPPAEQPGEQPAPSPSPSTPARPTPSPTATGAPSPSPSIPRPSSPSPAPTATSTPTPRPTATQTPAPRPTATQTPAPSPTPTATQQPSPAPTPTPTPTTPPPSSVGPPNAAAVATAIAFARQQLGEPYAFAGRGPDAWDCSGLTMQAYAAAGYSIGGHGATMQYRAAQSRGQLVPYAQRQPGDLIFYAAGGSTSGSKYHVAIYVGGNRMIEAPSPGRTVREWPVYTYDLVPFVARPTA